MSTPLESFNNLPESAAITQLLSCCGAKRWAHQLAAARPFTTPEDLYTTADQIWSTMQEPDWLEAIATHPRIGDPPKKESSPAHATVQSQQWSTQEQSQTQAAEAVTLAALAEGNRAYEEKFGITYIVCATGKSAAEMLAILHRRLNSTREAELRAAAQEQQKITRIRLHKLLHESSKV